MHGIDIDKIRNETPYCEDKLFFNSAGASLNPRAVTQSILDYIAEEQRYGGYKCEEIYQDQLSEFYDYAAQLIHTKPRNIAFAHDATDAYSRALSSFNFKSGDIIITTDDDYVSNHIQFISLKQKHGIVIKRIKNLDNGDLDLDDFETLVKEKRPALVAITYIPTNSGLIQDVVSIGEVCEREDIPYLLDACQAIGQLDVNVQKIKCDFLSTTGRKFLRGPRGTGFLYVSDKMLERGFSPKYVDLSGADWTGAEAIKMKDTARRFQHWEGPCALIMGIREAIKYALSIGLKNIESYNQTLITHMMDQLSPLGNIRLLDKGSHRAAIVTIAFDGKGQNEIVRQLDKAHVYYSIARKSSAWIDFDKKNVEWAIRISPHYFNTVEEIDALSEIISGIK